MASCDVKLTGEVAEFNGTKTSATVTVSASGSTFPDQIEVLNSKPGQVAAIEAAVAGGLVGIPTIRKTVASAFPSTAEGEVILPGSKVKTDHYAMTYLVTAGLGG